MNYLLFIIYLAILSFILTRISFIQKAGIATKLLVALFSLKVIAGIAVGWISQRYYPGNDYWGMNNDALAEYDLLMHHPSQFFSDTFKSPYEQGYNGFFNSIGSYWNDLRYNLVLKMLAFFDVLSRGNYYINSLFFNFIGFFGHIALYRVFTGIYKNSKWPILAGCFLLPSTLYFSSGIHKDLLLFTLLGLFCYAMYRAVTSSFTIKRILLIGFCLTGILLLRNYVFFLLLPPAIIYLVCYRYNRPAFKYFGIGYGLLLTILLVTAQFDLGLQPLRIIAQKKQDFSALPQAVSQLPMDSLVPTPAGFAHNFLQAADHGFLRPGLWDVKSRFLALLAIELSIYLLLILLCLIRRRKETRHANPFIVFGIFFCLTMFLLIGYIVPNEGSIVRYRSIYLPFILVPTLVSLFGKTKGQHTLF